MGGLLVRGKEMENYISAVRGAFRHSLAIAIPICIIALCTATTSVKAVQYDVIAGNGTFIWDTNGDGLPDGWYIEQNGNLIYTSALARPGIPPSNYSERINVFSGLGQSGNALFYKIITVGSNSNVQVGDTLHASGYIKATLFPNGYVQASVDCFDGSWNNLLHKVMSPVFGSQISGYTKQQTDLVVPPDTMYVEIRFRLGAGQGLSYNRLDIVNVQVTKDVSTIPAPSPDAFPAVVYYEKYGIDPVYAAKRFNCSISIYEDSPIIQAFRIYNPNMKVFLYTLPGFIENDYFVDDPVPYPLLDKNYPNLFVLDQNGQRLTVGHFVLADIGNPVYQKLFADAAIKMAQSRGDTGIFLDGIAPHYAYTGFGPTPRFPNDTAWVAATDSFLRYVIARIHRAGLIAAINGGAETWNTSPMSDWASLVDAYMYEQPCDSQRCWLETPQHWESRFASYRMFPNKIYFDVTRDTDPQRLMSEFATHLIASTQSSYFGGQPIDSQIMNITTGSPTENPVLVAYRTYRRIFEHAIAFINYDDTKSSTVQIPSGCTDLSGNPVPSGSRTLAPTEGLILIK